MRIWQHCKRTTCQIAAMHLKWKHNLEVEAFNRFTITNRSVLFRVSSCIGNEPAERKEIVQKKVKKKKNQIKRFYKVQKISSRSTKMESNSLKRMRSDEDESNNNVPQTKVWVNEKLSDSRNPDKMKAVHGE